MSDRITVFPEGQRTGVVLTQNEHLATGGEGAVYLRGDKVFKVYLDPAKARARQLDRKLPVLKGLKHPGIAAPEGMLLDKDGAPIGLVLPFVQGEAMCRAFTNTWRDSTGFAEAQSVKVTDAMREIVQHAHSHKALLVDGNELNWLLDKEKPVAIDVDSWQVPGFPATAIMPSIRDHAFNSFSEGTDWFAWAIVTFQLWVGIHPYRGTHPTLGKAGMEERMRARASVFDPGVRLPGAARDLNAIPARLRDWYAQTFSTTDRTPPPRAADSAVAPQTAPRMKVIQSSTATLKVERIGSLAGKIAATINGFVIVRGPSGLELWDAISKAKLPRAQAPALELVLKGRGCLLRLPAATVLLTSRFGEQSIEALDLDNGQTSSLPAACQGLWQSNNRAFVRMEGTPLGLQELDVQYLGTRLVLAPKQRWPVSVLSTTLMRNVFVQDMLDARVVGVFTQTGFFQGVCTALQGYRVAAGYAGDEQNVWLAATRLADGERVLLRLHFERERFHLDEETVAVELAIDAASTRAGVSVLRTGDEFLLTKGTARKKVSCAGLSPKLRLFGAGDAIAGFEDTEVMRISLT